MTGIFYQKHEHCNSRTEFLLRSPAKVNFCLWIKGKRRDGYHEIITIMHTISLYDVIHIRKSKSYSLRTYGQFKVPCDENNTVLKAVQVFHRYTNITPAVSIDLYKNIPPGAGLGGGSSNAATVLKAINTMYGGPLSERELFEMSAEIGSDVPFFIRGGLAIATGRGEKLEFFSPVTVELTVIYPGFSCSTADVYANMPEVISNKTPEDARKIIKLLTAGNNFKPKNKLNNDLEMSKSRCTKSVIRVKEILKSHGIDTVMSGSGSSLFTLENKPDTLLLKKHRWWFKFCHTV